MTPRAPALPAAERRLALIEATLPLLHEHGRSVTTRQIADAAGVAEGTIFRVFNSKDELVDEAVLHAFRSSTFVTQLEDVDPALPLRERLLAITRLLQERYISTFGLIRALGTMGPPAVVKADHGRHEDWRRHVDLAMVRLVEPDADLLRVPAARLVNTLRLLTLGGSNEHMNMGDLMAPEEIVDTVLVGLLADPRGSS
ncbi:AcrR family transcriptional regulator [Marmoricola sp. OAE513]|uniref:TetR/AcrR family transcriptional regulator n=1 Tax=Marmoricola sp. OAE513 TaxID=2817894 RepID=UPI001AE1CBC0